MGLYFENEGFAANPDEFKAIVPNALSAEDWFRFPNRYANGEPIVKARWVGLSWLAADAQRTARQGFPQALLKPSGCLYHIAVGPEPVCVRAAG